MIRSGRALSSQHGGGADLTRIAYNDTDGSRTVTNSLGSQTVYRFTTLQGALKVTQIDRLATGTTAAATIKFTYDSNGYPASQTDWNGNLTNYVNDAADSPPVSLRPLERRRRARPPSPTTPPFTCR